jgi:hypothetical protein
MFPQNDPVYEQAFRKLDDEVHGYASSKFSSSAWTPDFTRALWARPLFLEQPIEGIQFADQKCQACNRSGHQPKWQIQFSGPAYYKKDLEEIDQGHSDHQNDSEDGDESDNESVNSKGHPIPKEDTVWLVGRFCKANAETAHSLIHWKHALNEWVLETLKTEGHLAPNKLAERDGWKTRRKSDYANGIVDQWEKEGQIKGLYREFKTNLEQARDKKQTRFKH